MATKTTRAPLALAPGASCGCGAHEGEEGRKAVGVDADAKERNGKRLRRIEGQARGIQKMVDEDRYCADGGGSARVPVRGVRPRERSAGLRVAPPPTDDGVPPQLTGPSLTGARARVGVRT
jgi:hypothetical protein